MLYINLELVIKNSIFTSCCLNLMNTTATTTSLESHQVQSVSSKTTAITTSLGASLGLTGVKFLKPLRVNCTEIVLTLLTPRSD